LDEPARCASFPREDSLCEACGYWLRGLDPAGNCPECGLAIVESDPGRRLGLPWQSHTNWRAWLATTGQIVRRPSRAFRQMRVDGPNGRDRLYLGGFAAMMAIIWGSVWVIADLPGSWFWAGGAAAGMIVLTYVEAAGVAWFSRRRGWRVPFALAERIACYAAVGWMPAGLVLAAVQALAERGTAVNWWPATWGPYPAHLDLAFSAAFLGISILWFETLVWLGVRKARFAGFADTGCAQRQ
jgi:hypothetical protein